MEKSTIGRNKKRAMLGEGKEKLLQEEKLDGWRGPGPVGRGEGGRAGRVLVRIGGSTRARGGVGWAG